LVFMKTPIKQLSVDIQRVLRISFSDCAL